MILNYLTNTGQLSEVCMVLYQALEVVSPMSHGPLLYLYYIGTLTSAMGLLVGIPMGQTYDPKLSYLSRAVV